MYTLRVIYTEVAIYTEMIIYTEVAIYTQEVIYTEEIIYTEVGVVIYTEAVFRQLKYPPTSRTKNLSNRSLKGRFCGLFWHLFQNWIFFTIYKEIMFKTQKSQLLEVLTRKNEAKVELCIQKTRLTYMFTG